MAESNSESASESAENTQPVDIEHTVADAPVAAAAAGPDAAVPALPAAGASAPAIAPALASSAPALASSAPGPVSSAPGLVSSAPTRTRRSWLPVATSGAAGLVLGLLLGVAGTALVGAAWQHHGHADRQFGDDRGHHQWQQEDERGGQPERPFHR